MEAVVAIYLFIIGLAFGSFALAMVDRMKASKNWVSDRSQCDSCKTTLQVKDLVPVVSWLSTHGRCRHCGVQLSVAYPLAEVGLGLAFVGSFIFWPQDLSGFFAVSQFVVWLVALVIMTALFIFDIRWFLLPNKLVYPLILVGLLWAGLDVADSGLSVSIAIEYLLAVVVGSGIFLLLFIFSGGQWIGDGDVRLGVALGLFSGSWAGAWLVIFLASVTGLGMAVVWILSHRKSKKKHKVKIPFGPALLLGLYLVVLFGTQIIDWYKTDILLL